MSLIQDALKRQQEETESSRVPLKSAVAPSVPDAMPVPLNPGAAGRPLPVGRPLPAAVPSVNPEKPVRSGKSWKLIAGIIIFCILIVFGGGLLVRRVLKQPVERTLLGSFIQDLTHGSMPLGKSSVQAPTPAAQPPVTAMSKTVVNPETERAAASRLLLSPAAAAAPAFADEGEDAEENAALPGVKEQVEPEAVPGTATWPQRKIPAVFSNVDSDQESARLKPVIWPRLKLSAVFSNVSSGQSGARLNNRLILLGDQIDGVTLVEIHRDSVVLKCGKETRLLKMGAILN